MEKFYIHIKINLTQNYKRYQSIKMSKLLDSMS